MTTSPYRRTMSAESAATAVTTTGTPERYAKVRAWAEGASRRLVLQSLADMAYAACERATAAVYDELPGVGRINVYPDGRVRITLPWSKHTGEWPLSRDQRELVRSLLFAQARQFDSGKNRDCPPLYFFDEARRRWCINLGDYPTITQASTWLAWARAAWTPAHVEAAQRWLETHAPDGRRRGPKVGANVGQGRALG